MGKQRKKQSTALARERRSETVRREKRQIFCTETWYHFIRSNSMQFHFMNTGSFCGRSVFIIIVIIDGKIDTSAWLICICSAMIPCGWSSYCSNYFNRMVAIREPRAATTITRVYALEVTLRSPLIHGQSAHNWKKWKWNGQINVEISKTTN